MNKPASTPALVAFAVPLRQKRPKKKEGANCETTTNEINPMEYNDSSLENLT